MSVPPIVLDPARATFVRKAYRQFIAKDDSVLANYPSARSIPVVTNLSGSDALALANKILQDGKVPKLSFEVEFEGTMELGTLVGQNPSVIANFPKLKTTGRAMRIVSVRTDYETNTTTVTVRG